MKKSSSCRIGFAMFCSAFIAITCAAQTTLISVGSVWKYLDNGTDQGVNWRQAGFTDTTWPSGAAQFGYGDGDEITTNTFGPDAQNVYPTYYYRHTFNLPNAAIYTNLGARLLRDDGAIVYLNGTEVFRSNMPTGEVRYTNYAVTTAPDDGATFIPFNISASPLINGDNVIAVELHQANATSSDISFDFELTGNPLPQISISSPTNDQVLAAVNVLVSGTAIPAGPDVGLIEIFANSVKVGESANANFNVLWQGVAPGGYTLTALITDSLGLKATSAPVSITIQSPPAGTLVARGSVWRYVLGTQEASIPTTLWRMVGFDDAAWFSGSAPVGYGEPNIATLIPESDANPGTNWTSVFLRRKFTVNNPADYAQLTVEVIVDDGAIVWINGMEAGRINVDAGEPTFNDAALVAEETRTLTVTTSAADFLVAGENVVALMGFNANLTSSDFVIDAEVRGQVDLDAPFVTQILPPATATVRELKSIEVFFSENVVGVDASDLLINNEAATNVVVLAPDQYLFEFPEPPTGAVQVAWSADNGITDTASTPNPFLGGAWNYILDPNAIPPSVIISEFMASNDQTLNDQFGESEDWIELHNPGAVSVNLDGYFLTDDPTHAARWRIPAVTLLPGAYMVIFASGTSRTNVTQPLHTDFNLRANAPGDYLALLDPNLNVLSAFSPTYGEQFTDVSFGRDVLNVNFTGYFATPTPRGPNSTQGTNFAPGVTFSVSSRTFLGPFNLTLTAIGDPAAQIRYVLVTNAAQAATTNIPSMSAQLYTGPLPITGTIQVRARAFSTGKLPGTPHTESYIQINQNLAPFSSDIPLVLIHNFGAGEFSAGAGTTLDTPSIVMVFDTVYGRSSLTNVPDVATRAGINLRGSSTQGFTKRSYAVEFWDELNNDIDYEVLGMPAESDWVLYAPNQFDISLIHNPLAYELCNDVNQYAARTRMVETFVNTTGGIVTGPAPSGNYFGVFVLEEKLKRNQNRVDIANLQPEHSTAPNVTGGYLLKVDRQDANERSFSAGGLTLIYVEPDGLEMVTAQRTPQAQYIASYINSMNNAINGTGHENFLDEVSWIDFNLNNMLTINVDAFRLSGFLYKDRDEVDARGVITKPGKVIMGPAWDYDRAMGTSRGDTRPWDPFFWKGQGGDTGTHFFDQNGTFSNPWYRVLFRKLDFWQKYIDRYQELRDSIFSTNHIHAIIDRMGLELRESSVRETTRWRGSGGSDTSPRTGTENSWDYPYTFDGTYQGEINFQKRWFTDRLLFIDTNFLGRPIFSQPGGQINPGFNLFISGPSGATVYYTLDGTDPRAPGGMPAQGALISSGVVTVNENARVVARSFNAAHRNLTGGENPPISSSWSGPRAGTFVTQTPPLRITEVMYHPLADTNLTDQLFDEDFEYIEVKNISASTISLNKYRLRGGIEFTFPDIPLGPGSNAVVVSYLPAFSSRYGTNMIIAGTYSGHLANEGDHIILEGPKQEPIHDFEFNDKWYLATDGYGFSLVIRNETGVLTAWNDKPGWRPSGEAIGSPGVNNAADPNIPVVLINEALTHTDLPDVDAIELYNPNGFAVNVGGWYLSDDFRTPKYRLPNTSIPGHSYVKFTEAQFNATPGATNSFNLRSSGDDVFLYSADAQGNLTGYIQGYEFEASLNGVSFGRYVTSAGEEHFVAQAQNSLEATNAPGPKVGPIVISEIMYHPVGIQNGARVTENDRDEYIELQNITGQDVPLYDPMATTNTFRLRGAVDYVFPQGRMLPANSRILVVSFNPDITQYAIAFRAAYGLPTSTPLYGPWEGQLNNAGESIELLQPDVVVFYQTNTVITGVVIDKVDYDDELPWATSADGIGLSLNKIVPVAYGNDPTNWIAALPTPNAAYVPSPPPIITAQPQPQLEVSGSTASMFVMAGGPGPIRYQWRFNGDPKIGATNHTIEFNPVRPSDEGLYDVVVYNAGGAVVSDQALLTVLIPASILQQPQSQSVRPGQSVILSVQASSSTPISYQWRFNGNPIPGKTSPALAFPSVQRTDDGIYDVILTDAVGTIVSAPARLTVLIDPVILNFSTNYTVVQGANLILSVECDGTLPLSYRWRRRFTNLRSETINSYVSFYTITNLQPNTIGATNPYSVVITNVANSTPGVLSSNVLITVLADSDGDGLPNVWENQYFPGTGTTPSADSDQDGMTDREEFIAGTNPTSPGSYLKVENLSFEDGALIHFQAASNTTYSIYYKDSLEMATWTKLTDVAASEAPRMAVVKDSTANPKRFYLLATPKQ